MTKDTKELKRNIWDNFIQLYSIQFENLDDFLQKHNDRRWSYKRYKIKTDQLSKELEIVVEALCSKKIPFGCLHRETKPEQINSKCYLDCYKMWKKKEKCPCYLAEANIILPPNWLVEFSVLIAQKKKKWHEHLDTKEKFDLVQPLFLILKTLFTQLE